MSRNFFGFKQTAGRRGAIDLQSLLPALAIEVCPGAPDSESLAPLLNRELHAPVEEAAVGCSDGSQWQFARLQVVGAIVLNGLDLD